MRKKIKMILLIFLMVLPAFIPIGGRFNFIFPDAQADNPMSVIFLMIVLILPYWGTVGALSRLWIKDFFKAFFYVNIPIFLNLIGEVLYYYVFNIPLGKHLFGEYIIGSHIDKFQLFDSNSSFLGYYSGLFSISFSAICFLITFSIGYCIVYRYQKKRTHISLIP